MRIGVVTFSTSLNNYGQALQAFALIEILKKNGHEPFLIRYMPEGHPVPNVLRPIKKMYKACTALLRGTLKQERHSKQKDMQREFEPFRHDYLNPTARVYRTVEELQSHCPDADVYICGSDQIWAHPTLLQARGFFLDFGAKNKIAYAASLGHEFDDNDRRSFSTLIDDFSAISVRENHGLSECRKAGRSDASLVLDPTLLHDFDYYLDRFDLTIETNPSPYLFAYIVNVNSKDDIHWGAISKYLESQRLDLRVVYSSGYSSAVDVIPGFDGEILTIPEWIEAIANSSCVFTTSYHGAIFAILARKPFLIMPLSESKSISNDRINTLLETLGLADRLYHPEKAFEEQMNKSIDWDSVWERLESSRESSIQFLTSAINVFKNEA